MAGPKWLRGRDWDPLGGLSGLGLAKPALPDELAKLVLQAGTRRLREAEQRRREEEERRRLRALAPKVVIYTVHGTFARKATWIRPSSPMCKSLQRDLGWRVRIRPVLWSGRNTVRARWEGAQRLRKKINRGIRAFPDAQHFVIAHSHGGNVALSAIHDEDLSQKVAGVITLATPFLSARVVKPRELIDPGAGLVAAFVAFWITILAGVYFGHGWGWWPWALAALGGVLGVLQVGAWLNERMHKFARRLVECMPRAMLSEDKLAVVRVEGDEAIATLAGARFAGSLVRLFWRFLTAPLFRGMSRLLQALDYAGLHGFNDKLQARRSGTATQEEIVRRAGRFTYPLATQTTLPTVWESAKPMLWQFLPALVVEFYKWLGPTWRLVIFIVLGLYGVPAAVALVLVALSVPVGVLTSISLLPCGWTVPLAGPYLQLTAEPTPTGRSSVHQFEGRGDGSRLDHSYAYQDSQVWTFAAKWIEERLERGEESEQSTAAEPSEPA